MPMLRCDCCCGALTVCLIARYVEAAAFFATSDTRLRSIVKATMYFITARWCHKLLQVDVASVRANAAMFAARVQTVAPLAMCWGFLDATVRPVCRPSRNAPLQRDLYNGHKHVHALKYQTVRHSSSSTH